MKLAIVILNWNGKNLLEEYLPSVLMHSEGSDIYMIDNDSNDDSIAYVLQNHPDVKIIKLNNNYGFAGGYNKGLKEIDADIYCLLNNDVAVSEEWLNPIRSAFKALQNLAIAQPKILDVRRKEYFEYAGAAGGFIDKYGFPYCRGRLFNTLELDSGKAHRARSSG